MHSDTRGLGDAETFYDVEAFDVTFFLCLSSREEKKGGGFLGVGVGTSPAIIMLHLLSHSASELPERR